MEYVSEALPRVGSGGGESFRGSPSSQAPTRRRRGARGWLAIAVLVGVSFASYGGLFYLFDTYVKADSGTAVSERASKINV